MVQNKETINQRIDRVIFDNLLIEDQVGPGANCKFENLKQYLVATSAETKADAQKLKDDLLEKMKADIEELQQLLIHKMIQQKVDYTMADKKLRNEISDLTSKMEYSSKSGFSEINKKHECAITKINKLDKIIEED